MLTSSFNIVTVKYLWTKTMKKVNHNLMEEEDSSQCLKILSQYKVYKTKIDWQRGKQLWARHNVQFLKDSSVTVASEYLQCSQFWLNKLLTFLVNLFG